MVGVKVLLVCVDVDNLVVTPKDYETLDAIYAQLRRDYFVNIMYNEPWYLGCAFGRHEMKGVVKKDTDSVRKLVVDRFDI